MSGTVCEMTRYGSSARSDDAEPRHEHGQQHADDRRR